MFQSRTLFIALLLGLLGLWWFAGRHGAGQVVADRPNDPWVFRSVLDKQPRMITFALDDHLWVSYSTDSCSLYKAWAGGVDFDGAVYNMRHGPQPMSLGNAWFENTSKQPWSVVLGGQTEIPRTDYKGHRYTEDGHAEIMYDLVLGSGQRIRVNERPEYVSRERQKGFQRHFTLENVPAGALVSLKVNVASIADDSNLETDGKWTAGKSEEDRSVPGLFARSLSGSLTLNPGETTLTTYFVKQPLIINPFDAERKTEEAESATVSPGERLMAKSDCRTCHNPKVPTVGPSYVQIAERYKNEPANVEKLAQKVIKGGSGTFGVAAMSAHPDLTPEDANALVSYVLSFDDGDDDGESSKAAAKSLAEIPENKWLQAETGINDREMRPGLLLNLFRLSQSPNTLNEISFSGTPALKAIAGKMEATAADFGDFKNNIAMEARGYLYLDKDDNIVLQLSSDDGSRLFLDGRMLIDNDGPHGMDPKEAEVALKAGYHTLRILYFQGGGGQGISLKWARFNEPGFKTIPEQYFAHKSGDDTGGAVPLGGQQVSIPGDGSILKEVHPAYTLSQARPDEFLPKVAGMDFLPDGRLLVSTWDAMGALYVLSNVESGDPKKIKVKRIAQGLAEPLGVKVVDGEIYVLQKQELTKLIDKNGDDIIDEYQCFAKGWRASANFHEFAFGLAYKDDYFYACLAIAINPGGASTRPQIPDRGKVLKISRKDGSVEFVARGLRTPNGINIGPDGEIFVADNQGDWLPSSKILHVKPGAFYNSYAVDSAAVAQMPVQQPVVWLPQDDIGNSPTQPILLDEGPYRNQLLHGDVCYGGLQRVFMEKINGDYQGCVFRFTQGLEGGTNRIVRGPDGAYYVGCIGNPGNWSQQDKLWYGLQRLKYNGQSVFEMLAVHAKTDGVEVEFTEPLREGDGWDVAHYQVKQWWYKPTVNYGGPKMDEENLTVRSASVSADRKKVFLEIPGIKPGHVVYLRLQNLPLSDEGHEIWTTETWYTMNNIPANMPGEKRERPAYTPPADNTLSEKEKAAGWTLLFDGKSINGWHNYGKTTIGKSWVIADNALHLDAQPNPSGHWQAADGGDILTSEEYQDFEFTLEWKIGPCGNSGIFYNVTEDASKFAYGWMTGPEMQVLDNTCHPDSRIHKHRAGDLYDLIPCKYETVKPAGEWNKIRIISKNGHLEHWLNDRKVVETQMFTKEWSELIAGSKFKDMKGFGLARKGRIALQDHGDPVWYKNIKIRRL
jgi:cytochrome c